MTKNICPVCGFDGLEEPPYGDKGMPSYEICPCCGFEFGFDEEIAGSNYESFRSRWIASGALWFMPERKPGHWVLKTQLKNIKH